MPRDAVKRRKEEEEGREGESRTRARGCHRLVTECWRAALFVCYIFEVFFGSGQGVIDTRRAVTCFGGSRLAFVYYVVTRASGIFPNPLILSC